MTVSDGVLPDGSGDAGGGDVGGVPVERGSGSTHGGPQVAVGGGLLDVPERHACVETGKEQYPSTLDISAGAGTCAVIPRLVIAT